MVSNDDYLVGQHAEIIIQEAVRLACAEKSKEILVTGFATTSPTNLSGRVIQENWEIAKARALMSSEARTRLAIPKSIVSLT